MRAVSLHPTFAFVLTAKPRSPNGVRFIATSGSDEFTKRHQPQSGDIVSFKHHGFLLASKKPKLPTLHRVRTDITWKDVLSTWKEHKPLPPGILASKPEETHSSIVPPAKILSQRTPKGYWKHLENRQKFFLDFAKRKDFDPYVAENWESVALADLKGFKVFLCPTELRSSMFRYGECCNISTGFMARLKQHFQSSLLVRSPGYEWKISNSESDKPVRHYRPRGYWDKIDNRKNFIAEIAEEVGIDPRSPQQLSTITTAQILRRGVSIPKQSTGETHPL